MPSIACLHSSGSLRGWPVPLTLPAAGPAAWIAGLLLGLGLLLPLAAGQRAVAQDQGPMPLPAVPLQCRLGNGPWRNCRMEVKDVGLHWELRIGEERFVFRHSGDGAVRMQKGAGPWQPVTASWQADASLCWDGVCAKGNIPLD